MTNEVKLLPSKDLFYHSTIPEPLDEEARQWLARQLHEWPNRVNEARTCAIGALTDMAVTEFCRLMSERSRPTIVTDEVVERVAKVMCAEMYGPLENGSWALLGEHGKDSLRRCSRAVLAAMPAIVR